MVFSISHIFIKRPVLTTVCTLIIVLVGMICLPLLPVNYLPDIAPIQVQVSAAYTGADVETVENTVTSILERQINGVDKMMYTTSQTYAGNSQISVFFPSSTDKDIDQVNVQNRVARATAQLPSTVQQLGVTTQSASTSILLVYGIYSETDAYDSVFISSYLDLNVTDVLKRIPGVGNVALFGQKSNAMRLWLDPNALASRGLTTLDVANALRSQNVVVGAGAIGKEPVPDGQTFELPVRAQGRFKDQADFENLVIRTDGSGNLIRLRDVGRVELGAEDYSSNGLVKGRPAVGIAVYQAPGSNALDLAANIESTMERLQEEFPPGMKAELVYDTTAFIEVSIEEVLVTLFEAFVLVVLVIFIFLQDWRTTLIPLIAIPVSLIGALAFAFMFGFSINNLTLFGLILATGLVVDDAIVVVEGIATKMETGMKPRQATFEAMGELVGPVISMSLVLMAVFIPVAFFPGSTGKLYQQFALVIAFSIAVSAFNALSFSPSMSAILLKPHHGDRSGPLGWFFTKFNQFFDWLTVRYRGAVEYLIRIRYIVLGVFVVGLVATGFMFTQVPTGFVPNEDQGIFLGTIQGPDGVSLSYTDGVISKTAQIMDEEPEIETYFTASGAALDGAGPNKGLFFAKLKPWEERTGHEQQVDSILKRLNQKFAAIADARVLAFNIPPIPGFSAQGGFELQLQDQTGGKFTIDDFLGTAQEMIGKANEKPAIAGKVYTTFTAGTPQLQVDFDRNRLEALNVDFQQALQTLGATLGSQYVNDFTLGTRNYKAFVQADGEYRNSVEDISKLYVRSRDGKMIPLATVATITPITGPQAISHYNGYRSIKIQGSEAPGYSSGEALQAMDETVKENAIPGLGSDWVGLAREQLSAGSLGVLVFGLGIVMVFLTLAAQYESYVDPIVILLSVPLALLGALLALAMRGLINDVYANIALVMLIGLAAKNAILIVEFANIAREHGETIAQAAVTACKERLRPILMTAFAALAGFWPLVVAHGAGAASRISLGTALFGGLLVATFLSLLVVPVLYVIIKSLEDHFLKGGGKPPAHLQESHSHPEATLEPPTVTSESRQTLSDLDLGDAST